MQKLIWTAVKVAAVGWVFSKIFNNVRREDDTTREEAADVLDRFVEERGGPYDFTNLIEEYHGNDELINKVISEIWDIGDNLPGHRAFCNKEGMRRIRELSKLLRDNPR